MVYHVVTNNGCAHSLDQLFPQGFCSLLTLLISNLMFLQFVDFFDYSSQVSVAGHIVWWLCMAVCISVGWLHTLDQLFQQSLLTLLTSNLSLLTLLIPVKDPVFWRKLDWTDNMASNRHLQWFVLQTGNTRVLTWRNHRWSRSGALLVFLDNNWIIYYPESRFNLLFYL